MPKPGQEKIEVLEKAVCPRCRHIEFIVSWDTYDKRPRLTCTRCCHSWTNGHDGLPYLKGKFAKVKIDGKLQKFSCLTVEELVKVRELSHKEYLDSQGC